MKKLLLTFVIAAGLGSACNLSALSITPTTGTLDTSRWEGNEKGQDKIDEAIAAYLGSAIELYKNDVGKSDEGDLASSYATVFTPSTEPSAATISYVGGNIVGPSAFLLVKDGNNDPVWYLFNLTLLGWDGEDTLELSNFWPAQGGISHVTLYGTETEPGGNQPRVPDGGATLALLGLGLTSLGFARARFARK